MLSVVSVINDWVGIYDDTDGTVEYATSIEIAKYISKLGLVIKGATFKNSQLYLDQQSLRLQDTNFTNITDKLGIIVESHSKVVSEYHTESAQLKGTLFCSDISMLGRFMDTVSSLNIKNSLSDKAVSDFKRGLSRRLELNFETRDLNFIYKLLNNKYMYPILSRNFSFTLTNAYTGEYFNIQLKNYIDSLNLYLGNLYLKNCNSTADYMSFGDSLCNIYKLRYSCK